MAFKIALDESEFYAGGHIKGHLEFPSQTNLIPQAVEFRLSCTFCGGALVSPALNVKRMTLPQSPLTLSRRIEFMYPLPSELPTSSSRMINGVDQGVKYSLTARIIPAGLFHRSVASSVSVNLQRKDPGDGIKIKFAKIGGRPFKELLSEGSGLNVGCSR